MELERGVAVYLRHLTIERGLSEHTLGAYRRELGQYVTWLAGRGINQVQQITAGELAEFVAGFASAQPAPAAASLARMQASLRGWHRFLAREEIVPEDISGTLRPPRQAQRLPKALTIEQVELLLQAPPADDPVGLRDRALLELLYATGARVSEAIQLDVDDVSTGAAIRVRGKGNRERIVPLGSFARVAIEAYLTRARPIFATRGRGSARLFLGVRGGPISRQSAGHILRTNAELAGLGDQVSPHTLRHCYATHLLQGGADVRVVQELLGHASVATTQIYTHLNVDALRDAYASAHPRAQKSSNQNSDRSQQNQASGPLAG